MVEASYMDLNTFFLTKENEVTSKYKAFTLKQIKSRFIGRIG